MRPRTRWSRIAALLVLLLAGGCAARVSRVVESITFYAPSRAAFETPADIEDVMVRVTGRASIHGWWLERTTAAATRGTILFCHGNAGNLPDHLAFVDRFRRLGFDVLMFDYRGYGRSGRVAQINRNTLLRDTRAAARYLRERRAADTGPTVLIGHSMGAVIGAALIAERPDAFDGAVLVAPFSSFPRVASDFAGPLGKLLIRDGLGCEQSVQRFGATPVSIVFGEADRIVRPYHAERVAAAAAEAGVDVRTLRVPEADHVDIFDDRYGTAEFIASFIDECAR